MGAVHEGDRPNPRGARDQNHGRAVLDNGAVSARIAHHLGGIQEKVGSALAPRHHGRTEGAALEAGPEARYPERELDTFRRRDVEGVRHRRWRLGDPGGWPKPGAKRGAKPLAHRRERLGTDDEPALGGEQRGDAGEAAAEETLVALGGVEKQARLGARVKRPHGDRLDVDQHPFAIEDRQPRHPR
jgi:hypothetical protein